MRSEAMASRATSEIAQFAHQDCAEGVIEFVTYGDPITQGSMRNLYRNGRLTVIHDNNKLIPWRNKVGDVARRAMHGAPKLFGPLEMCIDFYLKRGRTVTRPRPCCKPDLDKLVRSIGDALEGIFYTNDSQVVRVIAQKHYGKHPRVEVMVRELG